MDTVKNTAAWPVDLADGRMVGVGETAEDVDLSEQHNRSLADDGYLTVVSEQKTTRGTNRKQVKEEEDG